MEEIKEFTVHDRLGPLTFRGKILSDKRYEPENKPRWTDMALYRITNPEGSRRPAKVFEKALLQEFSPEERTALGGDVMARLARILGENQPVYHYVLEIIARSLVYHRVSGPCVKGRHLITTVGNARQDHSAHRWRYLYPCPRCTPPDLEKMRDTDKFAEERDDLRTYLCTDARDISSRLYKRNGEISSMAADLLHEAALKDAQIAYLMKSARRV